MRRYTDAKKKIQEKHNGVPIEATDPSPFIDPPDTASFYQLRAREAALERMRKGRNEIESYHEKIYKERTQVIAKATNHRTAHCCPNPKRHKTKDDTRCSDSDSFPGKGKEASRH